MLTGNSVLVVTGVGGSIEIDISTRFSAYHISNMLSAAPQKLLNCWSSIEIRVHEKSDHLLLFY